jgi:hypothetical protein
MFYLGKCKVEPVQAYVFDEMVFTFPSDFTVDEDRFFDDLEDYWAISLADFLRHYYDVETL